MPRTRPSYPPEFKAEAVRLVGSGDRSLTRIAKDLGVADQTLRSWVQHAERSDGSGDAVTPSEREELHQLRREVRTLRQEREILKKSRSLLRQRARRDPVAVFAFVEAEKANYPVATLCRLLGVSRSGYYAWRKRLPSARSRANQELTRHIRAIHEQSRGTYGAPRVWVELRDRGVICSRKRVARLLRLAGLQGCHRRKGPAAPRRTPGPPPAPDLVQRQFTAAAPDRLWVADITYVPTWAGFLYLAVVLDVHSRRIVGWAMADHLRSELVIEAVDMAVWRRRPAEGVIHHSDQGSQYASLAFGRRLREAGLTGSMGSRGDCFDNATAESFFATLECELLARHRFPTRSAARLALFDSIEGCSNTHRRHSALGYLSPAAFERRCAQQPIAT